MLQADIDQPVEVRLRGDAVDVFGALMALLAPALEEGVDNDRAQDVIEDLSDSLNQQVNLGHYLREAKRAIRNDDVPDYRGIQVLVNEFDPRHPEPEGPGINRLSPLEEADYYAIVARTEYGWEQAGYPDSLDIGEYLKLASMLRMFARELEATVNAGSEDELPGGGDGE